MPEEDKPPGEKTLSSEAGIEYRATIRFPRKDYEFMQNLIENGEYANITDIVRDAVKRFRLEWRDMDEAQALMPMGPHGMMDMIMRHRFGHHGRSKGRSHASHHGESDHEEAHHGRRNASDDEEDDEEHSEE